jgi:hypothetical protein
VPTMGHLPQKAGPVIHLGHAGHKGGERLHKGIEMMMARQKGRLQRLLREGSAWSARPRSGTFLEPSLADSRGRTLLPGAGELLPRCGTFGPLSVRTSVSWRSP